MSLVTGGYDGLWTDSQVERQLSRLGRVEIIQESYNNATHSRKPQKNPPKLTAHLTYLSPEILIKDRKIENHRKSLTAQLPMQCANCFLSLAEKDHETSLSVGLTLLVAILTVAD